MKIVNQVIVGVVATSMCVPCFSHLGAQYDSKHAETSHVSYCADTNDTTSYYNKWALSRIGAFNAWDITTGSNDVQVGVIDSGIQANHEDLIGRVDSSLSEDFTGGNSPLTDSSDFSAGHGTAVAGIIGAIGNNGKGTAGVSHGGISLISYKVSSVTQVTSAIYSAKNAGVKILNISAEMTYTNDLITAINNFPGIIVCAAGNRNSNIDSESGYLNNLENDNIIVVGATEGQNDQLYALSNYGFNDVDLFAPGVSIYTTTKNGGYGYVTGTSFAAPFVAGTAALLLSRIPTLTAYELKKTILQNVYYVESLSDKCVTGGLISVNQSVTNIKHMDLLKRSQIAGDKIYHNATCLACKTTFKEKHDWQKYTADLNRCVKCRMESGFSGLPGGDYNSIGGEQSSALCANGEALCEDCSEHSHETTVIDELEELKESLVA